jgi:hypothetical protein
MEGKRFGAGLVAGVLLGLVIVTATSGFTFGLYGSFSAVSNNAGLVSSVTGAKSTATTSSQPPPSQNGSNSTLSAIGRSTTTTTTTMTTTTATTGPSPVGADFASATTPVYSSHVANIAQQPVLTNIIIFIPVFIAFLLGAVLYRVSTKRRVDNSEAAN